MEVNDVINEYVVEQNNLNKMFEIDDIVLKIDDPDLLKMEDIMRKIKKLQNES